MSPVRPKTHQLCKVQALATADMLMAWQKSIEGLYAIQAKDRQGIKWALQGEDASAVVPVLACWTGVDISRLSCSASSLQIQGAKCCCNGIPPGMVLKQLSATKCAVSMCKATPIYSEHDKPHCRFLTFSGKLAAIKSARRLLTPVKHRLLTQVHIERHV